jgi:hypothetical protein
MASLTVFFRSVASHFPNSLASMIVLSFHTASPGELSHKWKFKQETLSAKLFDRLTSSASSNRRVRRFTLTAAVITLLQQLGAMSPTLQRLFLHIAQPTVFGGLFMIGLLMTRHPLSFIGAGVVTLVGLAVVLRSLTQDRIERNLSEEEATHSREQAAEETDLENGQLSPTSTLAREPKVGLEHEEKETKDDNESNLPLSLALAPLPEKEESFLRSDSEPSLIRESDCSDSFHTNCPLPAAAAEARSSSSSFSDRLRADSSDSFLAGEEAHWASLSDKSDSSGSNGDDQSVSSSEFSYEIRIQEQPT